MNIHGDDNNSQQCRLDSFEQKDDDWSSIALLETMMKVRLMGFYQELPHAIPGHGCLKELSSEPPIENHKQIVHYLKNGHLFVSCPGIITDVLSGSTEPIGSPDILTDGIWAWPNDLSYYVDHYNVQLPSAFITLGRNNHWTIPENVDVSLLEM